MLQYISVYFLTGKPNIFCARPQPPSISPRPLLSLSSWLSLVSNVLGVLVSGPRYRRFSNEKKNRRLILGRSCHWEMTWISSDLKLYEPNLLTCCRFCIERSMEYGTTPPPDRRRKSKQATPPLLKDACILNRYSSIVLFSFPGCFQVRPPLSSPEVRLSPTIENQAVTSAAQARSPRPPSEDNTGSSSPWPGTTQTTTLSLVMFSN